MLMTMNRVTKKWICLTLVVVTAFSMFAGCGNTSKINPELAIALGDSWVKENEDTIHQLMSDLQNAYDTYMDDGDLLAFGTTVDALTQENTFIDIMREDLRAARDSAASEEQKAACSSLSLQSVTWIIVSWVIYQFNLELGNTTPEDDQAMEQDLFAVINQVSQFFYCQDIVSGISE